MASTAVVVMVVMVVMVVVVVVAQETAIAAGDEVKHV